jgi:hypothetical protein
MDKSIDISKMGHKKSFNFKWAISSLDDLKFSDSGIITSTLKSWIYYVTNVYFQ